MFALDRIGVVGKNEANSKEALMEWKRDNEMHIEKLKDDVKNHSLEDAALMLR